MKNLRKITLLAALGLASATIAHAQIDPQPTSPNSYDLILGFTSPTATSDYMLDLGPIPPGQTVQLGGISLSTFNSIFGSAKGVNVGVVGANNGGGVAAVITSALRTGLNPDSTPGDEGAPAPISDHTVIRASRIPNNLTLGVVTKTTDPSAPAGFSEIIAQDPNTPGTAATSYAGVLGNNPLSTIGPSEIITLDLWEQTAAIPDPWYYVGDLKLDLSGTMLSAVISSPAPEPGAYGVLAGIGLLALSLRRQSRKGILPRPIFASQ